MRRRLKQTVDRLSRKLRSRMCAQPGALAAKSGQFAFYGQFLGTDREGNICVAIAGQSLAIPLDKVLAVREDTVFPTDGWLGGINVRVSVAADCPITVRHVMVCHELNVVRTAAELMSRPPTPFALGRPAEPVVVEEADLRREERSFLRWAKRAKITVR